MQITASQQKILGMIREYWNRHGFGPSVRDLMKLCRYRSPRAVTFHLEKLEENGLIESDGKARTLRLKGITAPVRVPIYGSIPAGFGEVQSQLPLGELEVPAAVATAGVRAHGFALKVRGDSMVGAGIYEGDLAIVEQRQAKPGDIVVALIDGQSTLKRLVKRRGGFALIAENPKYPVLTPSENLEVQGVVVGLFRKV